MNRKRLRLCWLLIVLGIGTGTAWGRDGDRDKHTVITACTTISEPGSYALGNVIKAHPDELQRFTFIPTPFNTPPFPAAACILIAADFVTLDLQGYSIIGPPADPSVTAIAISTDRAHIGINVHSGFVTKFDVGVVLQGTSHTVAHIGAIQNNQDGISMAFARRYRLIGNTANENGLVGIVAGFTCLLLENQARGNGPPPGLLPENQFFLYSPCTSLENDPPP